MSRRPVRSSGRRNLNAIDRGIAQLTDASGKQGVRVLRFWEHDLQSVVKVTRAADLVAAAVKSTSGNAKRKRGRVIATVRRDKVINSHLSS